MALLNNRSPSRLGILLGDMKRHVVPSLKIIVIVSLLFFLLLRSGEGINRLPFASSLLHVNGNIIRGITSIYNAVTSLRDNVLVYFTLQHNLVVENQELRKKLQNMQLIENQLLQSEADNERLRSYQAFDMNRHTVQFSTVISFLSPLNYSSNAVIPAGSDNGVKQGQVVLSQNVLLGRVAGVGTNFASVLLVSDLNSRVPVYLITSGQRAILSGDVRAELKLQYLDDISKVQIGELIFTSGDGQYYPADIMVARVVRVENGEVFAEMVASPATFQPVDILNGQVQ